MILVWVPFFGVCFPNRLPFVKCKLFSLKGMCWCWNLLVFFNFNTFYALIEFIFSFFKQLFYFWKFFRFHSWKKKHYRTLWICLSHSFCLSLSHSFCLDLTWSFAFFSLACVKMRFQYPYGVRLNDNIKINVRLCLQHNRSSFGIQK